MQCREHLLTLQTFLAEAFQQHLTIEEVEQQAGEVIQRVVELTEAFQQLDIKREEYVCLKVLHLFTQGSGPTTPSVSRVQEVCLDLLSATSEMQHPDQSQRLSSLLILLPQITRAASQLIKHKLVYILFLFNGGLSIGKESKNPGMDRNEAADVVRVN